MLPYYERFLESTPCLPGTFFPGFVHVAKDHIRIDEKVIHYKGVRKFELEWIKKQTDDWAINPCDENNKEWVKAILLILVERLSDYHKNSKS